MEAGLNVCRTYARSGFCSHPESCIYAHPPQGSAAAPVSSAVAPAYMPYPYPTAASYPPAYLPSNSTRGVTNGVPVPYPQTTSPPPADGRLSPSGRGSYSKSYRRQHEQRGQSHEQHQPRHGRRSTSPVENGHPIETMNGDGNYHDDAPVVNGYGGSNSGQERQNGRAHQGQGGKYRKKPQASVTTEEESQAQLVETEDQQREREEAERKEREEQEAAKKKREEEIDAKIELIRQKNAQILERQQEILKDEAQAKEQEAKEKKQHQKDAYRHYQRNKSNVEQHSKSRNQNDGNRSDSHRGGREYTRKDYSQRGGEHRNGRSGNNEDDAGVFNYKERKERGGRGRGRGGPNRELFDWKKDQR
eukprot:TRINITY_DN14948_c0_g1_i1.p1 TRINITY_DN14948_c0_g1~~TRINITY_DN14948_c0_g1_i1.p1  ORF type:complete len:361 (+),score=85.76 TRINITY_DN14948_c0_g1_i1:216-1298(+)